MRKLMIGISLVMVMVCLCGCNTTKNNDEDVVEKEQYVENNNLNNLEENSNQVTENNENINEDTNVNTEIISGEKVEVISPEEIVNEDISSNWEDGEFLYNGKKVKLICNFSELQRDLGLKFNDETKNEYVVNPNYTVSGGHCSVGNSENIVVNLINSSNEVKKYPQCDVDTFSINIFYLKKDNDTNYSKIQLAKNITWDSTKEEVIAAYGEPYKVTETEYGSNLYYRSSDSYSKLEFGFNNDLGMTSIYYTID